MALVRPITLQHVHPGTKVYAALFTSVENAAFLRSQLLAGNQDFSYSFIDARSIISTTHLFAAVFRALNDDEARRLKSRNVHSEIVFSLSPNNNIADSFRRFGIADDTRNLVVIKICSDSAQHVGDASNPDQESITAHLTEHVRGHPVAFDDAAIATLSDLDYIAKLYKVPLGSTAQKQSKSKAAESNTNGYSAEADSKLKRQRMENIALGAMALKGS